MRAGYDRDRGFVTTEWVLGLTVIVLPTMLLVGLLPSWAARHDAVGAAAREGARHAALAIDSGAPDRAARDGAIALLAGRGVSAHDVTVDVRLPQAADGRMPREGEVVVGVTIAGRIVTLPLVGEVSSPTVRAAHTRQLNPLRSQP